MYPAPLGYLDNFRSDKDRTASIILSFGYAINETLEGSAESLEEASEMANGALQAFDKLNVMDASQMGDVEQAEHINKLMNDARKQGADVRHGIS